MRIEISTAIAAPPEGVWPVLSSVASWPTWLPTVSRVDALDGNGLVVGAQFRVTQPRLRPAVWVVTEVEAPLRFRWQSRAPGMLLVGDHVIERSAGDASRVTLRLDFSGPVGVVAGWFYGSLSRSYVAREAEALRRTVETAVAQSAAGAAR